MPFSTDSKFGLAAKIGGTLITALIAPFLVAELALVRGGRTFGGVCIRNGYPSFCRSPSLSLVVVAVAAASVAAAAAAAVVVVVVVVVVIVVVITTNVTLISSGLKSSPLCA
jgi:hypothetical protein